MLVLSSGCADSVQTRRSLMRVLLAMLFGRGPLDAAEFAPQREDNVRNPIVWRFDGLLPNRHES